MAGVFGLITNSPPNFGRCVCTSMCMYADRVVIDYLYAFSFSWLLDRSAIPLVSGRARGAPGVRLEFRSPFLSRANLLRARDTAQTEKQMRENHHTAAVSCCCRGKPRCCPFHPSAWFTWSNMIVREGGRCYFKRLTAFKSSQPPTTTTVPGQSSNPSD